MVLLWVEKCWVWCDTWQLVVEAIQDLVACLASRILLGCHGNCFRLKHESHKKFSVIMVPIITQSCCWKCWWGACKLQAMKKVFSDVNGMTSWAWLTFLTLICQNNLTMFTCWMVLLPFRVKPSCRVWNVLHYVHIELWGNSTKYENSCFFTGPSTNTWWMKNCPVRCNFHFYN